jgi:hypothetical protein
MSFWPRPAGAPEYTTYFGAVPSYDYIREQLTAEGLELVVAYCDSEYGELSYRQNGAWGVEVKNGIERILTSQESAHMRWAENLRPGRPFRVLPNDVTRWLLQQLSLASLRATHRLSRRAIRNDPNNYEIGSLAGQEELIWKGNQNRWVSVRALVPWWHRPLGGELRPYQLFEARRETHPCYIPLVFSMRARRWVMTGHPDAEFVEVPVGAVNWLQRQVRRYNNID